MSTCITLTNSTTTTKSGLYLFCSERDSISLRASIMYAHYGFRFRRLVCVGLFCDVTTFFCHFMLIRLPFPIPPEQLTSQDACSYTATDDVTVCLSAGSERSSLPLPGTHHDADLVRHGGQPVCGRQCNHVLRRPRQQPFLPGHLHQNSLNRHLHHRHLQLRI